ncbi:unnamed protein product [Rhodiola kirilowii]
MDDRHTHNHSHHHRRNNSNELGETLIREIHALQPRGHREPWDTSSHVSSAMASDTDNFTTISREFSALVVAGSAIRHDPDQHQNSNNMLAIIGEGRDEVPQETNPLTIVHQQHINMQQPLASRERIVAGETCVQRVKRKEIESKITAWQNAKVAKINNRFKREDAIIGGWENGQFERASASMKKVERKLEEKQARAMEKMQNDVAKARRKTEEKRASAEANRGTKVAKVFQICNLMRAVGKPPSKMSLF